MISLSLAYIFAVASPQEFDVNVQLDGFLPLFGGKVGKANVNLTVVATAVDTSRVESYISKMDAVAFGVNLPVGTENIDLYFPKSIATLSTVGEVLKTTAPEIKMPVKLPGLDSRRLPEISFLPLQLPRDAVSKGSEYKFKRDFGGQIVNYTVTVSEVGLEKAEFKIALQAESTVFADVYGNPQAEEKGARKLLKSVLTGTGTATFLKSEGQFENVVVESLEKTDITPIGKGEASKRELKTKLTIKRKSK